MPDSPGTVRAPESGFTPEQIRAQLVRIVSHPRFAAAERFRSFLQFTVEKVLAGQADEIKEYTIALEVYGRKPDYDPKIDSTVRVEASRVRTRLQEYYETAGVADPIRIEYPKGSYVPVFQAVREPAAEVATPGEQAAPPPDPKTRRPGWQGMAAALAVLLAAGVGWWAWQRTVTIPQSIGVRAFLDLSLDPAGRALSQAVVKEVESALTRSGRLRVTPVDARPDLVLEGTIRSDGATLRIVAQLLSSGTGGYIWSNAYDREAGLTFARQEDLAHVIADETELQAIQYAMQLTARGTPRAQALELFRSARMRPSYDRDGLMMRGAAALEHVPLDELNRSISRLEQAVAVDPQFAAAHSALASFYEAAAEYDPRIRDKARASARRAIAIDPRLGEAHGILGYILFLLDWRVADAAVSFRTALESEPRILSSYRFYADALCILGRFDEAIRELERARLVYPNHPVVETSMAIALYHARRFPEMEAQARRTAERHPEFPAAHWALGLALERLNRLTEAAQAEQECLRLSPGDTRCTPALGHIYAKAGRREEARAVMAKLNARPATQSRAAYSVAIILAGLGERAAALDQLEAALTSRTQGMPYAVVEPRFDPLRAEPRFQALLSHIQVR